MNTRSSFTCPVCGSHNWGSSYNFDGLGDTPMISNPGPVTSLDTGGRSTRYRGTWTRQCHGYLAKGPCYFQWNSRDDLAYGIQPPQAGTAVGMQR
jgi:hypothetical protein